MMHIRAMSVFFISVSCYLAQLANQETIFANSVLKVLPFAIAAAATPSTTKSANVATNPPILQRILTTLFIFPRMAAAPRGRSILSDAAAD